MFRVPHFQRGAAMKTTRISHGLTKGRHGKHCDAVITHRVAISPLSFFLSLSLSSMKTKIVNQPQWILASIKVKRSGLVNPAHLLQHQIKNITQTPSLLHWARLKHISNTICFARILTLIYVHFILCIWFHSPHLCVRCFDTKLRKKQFTRVCVGMGIYSHFWRTHKFTTNDFQVGFLGFVFG